MLNLDVLCDAGLNVDEALQRVMGNQTLLERLLILFLEDPHCQKLVEAVDGHDSEGAIDSVHSLKGTAGNLSMTALFDLATDQLALLREGKWDDAAALMPQIVAAHAAATDAIRKALATG